MARTPNAIFAKSVLQKYDNKSVSQLTRTVHSELAIVSAPKLLGQRLKFPWHKTGLIIPASAAPAANLAQTPKIHGSNVCCWAR